MGSVDMVRLGWLREEPALRASVRYEARVTPYVLSLTDFNEARDPLLRQWLPDGREMARLFSDASDDPFGELGSTPVPGLVHRFPDRVLVMVSRGCAMRCRHCTRKNTLEASPVVKGRAALSAAVKYVREHAEVREVILSGGDPLLLADKALVALVEAFKALPQVDAVRIGTRAPSVLPMRITTTLARSLGRGGRLWINTQFNHAGELTRESAAACARLANAGIPLSNQAVLLAGVNDSVQEMAALCRGLQRMRVRPYYVFQCDPVTGSLHFRVPVSRARRIAGELAKKVGGLALPRFVVDVPGAACKRPV